MKKETDGIAELFGGLLVLGSFLLYVFGAAFWVYPLFFLCLGVLFAVIDINSEDSTEDSPPDTDDRGTDDSGDLSISIEIVWDDQESNAVEQSKTCVNEASFDELLRLPGIGAVEANMIIKRRDEKPFLSTVELVDFLELKPHFATRLEELIDFRSDASDKDENVDAPVGQATPSNAPHRGRVID